jgi:hypothetical protein
MPWNGFPGKTEVGPGHFRVARPVLADANLTKVASGSYIGRCAPSVSKL